jgi:hypothetical protein
VVDRVCLENRCAFTGTGGSNPSLSAFGRRSDLRLTKSAGTGRARDHWIEDDRVARGKLPSRIVPN